MVEMFRNRLGAAGNKECGFLRLKIKNIYINL